MLTEMYIIWNIFFAILQVSRIHYSWIVSRVFFVFFFVLITHQYKLENKLSKMAKISKFIKDAAVSVFLVVNISEVLLNMKTYL